VNLARVFLIVAALLAAGLTALLVRNFLHETENRAAGNAAAQAALTSVHVMVAAKDLAAGTILGSDDVRWQSWPEDSLHPAYVRQGSGADKNIAGAAVRRAIAAGEPITSGRLVRPGEAGFLAGALTAGMRAATVQVTAETGAAGFILPGDRIDVVLTRDVQNGEPTEHAGRQVISETVSRDIRVLAVDQTVDDVKAQAQLGKTVTLEVTPRQAEALAVAKQVGQVSLALRSLARNPAVEDRHAADADAQLSGFLMERTAASRRVLTAARGLPAGTLLRDTDIVWVEQGPDAIAAGMVVEAQASMLSLRGSYLKRALTTGETINQSDLIAPGEQGFILAALAPGLRAVSVEVTQVSGVSGFVSPGDRVDVILTHEVQDTSDNPVLNPRRFTETVLHDIRLLAIEQTVDPMSGKPVVGKTVTLEVTAQQSEVVALAAAMGTMSLALRSTLAAELPATPNGAISDLGLSGSLRDFLVRGTARDPDLLRHRSEAGLAGTPSLPRGCARAVRVYRALQSSTVTVGR